MHKRSGPAQYMRQLTNDWKSGQKSLLEFIQKPKSISGRSEPPTCRMVHQPIFDRNLNNGCQRAFPKAGAFAEQADRYTIDKSQGIQHEFESQIVGINL
ncbi:MAG: hypothetical protein VYC03_06940, partial [Pseudomonadota bacterium]|nr:hypothetical protein [Pseudomonadota bacterium]